MRLWRWEIKQVKLLKTSFIALFTNNTEWDCNSTPTSYKQLYLCFWRDLVIKVLLKVHSAKLCKWSTYPKFWSSIQRLEVWSSLFVKSENQSGDENSPWERVLPTLCPIMGFRGQEISSQVVHNAECFPLWEVLCWFWTFREPPDKAWHVVWVKAGGGRHIIVLGLFCLHCRGRMRDKGADVLFMLHLIHNWFKIQENLRHAVKKT